MIDPGEILIGAYVKCGEEIYIVSGIDDNGILETKDLSGQETLPAFAENFEPIPLTEQWLIDLGLKKEEKNNIWPTFIMNKYIVEPLPDKSWAIRLKVGVNESHSLGTFLYVHQLQGLVKFLTDKLLTKYHE